MSVENLEQESKPFKKQFKFAEVSAKDHAQIETKENTMIQEDEDESEDESEDEDADCQCGEDCNCSACK